MLQTDTICTSWKRKEKTEKGRKRKALEEDLIPAKKKLELERVSMKLLDTADKKAKDAEKKKDATVMKA